MSHKIVQIGMYYFTSKDIARISHVNAGNEAVNDRFLARYDSTKEQSTPPTETSTDSFRKFWLITKYKTKQWYENPLSRLQAKPSPPRVIHQNYEQKYSKQQDDSLRRNSPTSNSTPLARNIHHGRERESTYRQGEVVLESVDITRRNRKFARMRSNHPDPPQVVNLPSVPRLSKGTNQIMQPLDVSSDADSLSAHQQRPPNYLYATISYDLGLSDIDQDSNSTISAEDLSVSTKGSSSITSIYRNPSSGSRKNKNDNGRRVSFMRESRQRLLQQGIWEPPSLPTIESGRSLLVS